MTTGAECGAATARVTPGRVSAAMTVACALAHVSLVDIHAPVRSLVIGLAMAATALACLPGTRVLWRAPTRRVWRATGAMNALMLGLHTAALLPLAGAAAVHATHLDAGAAALYPRSLMQLAMILAFAQTALAAAALLLSPASGPEQARDLKRALGPERACVPEEAGAPALNSGARPAG